MNKVKGFKKNGGFERGVEAKRVAVKNSLSQNNYYFSTMKFTLGNTLIGILLIVTLIIIYTIEVEADFSAFDTKATIKTIFYLILPIAILYIGGKFSKKK
jgi:hypothetical protein